MSFELQENQSAIDFGGNKKTRDGLNIIALVDVAFFLLIFFMVAGTIDRFEIIDITPPKAISGAMLDEGHIVILLGTYGEIVMDDTLVNMAEMEASLKQQLALNPDKVITLKADASIPAVKMIDVMDAIKAAGGKQITIATESEGK